MKLTLKHQSEHNVTSEIFKFTSELLERIRELESQNIENELIQLLIKLINKQDEMIRLLEANNLELSKKIESIYEDTAYRISKHYGFSWNYDEILDKWVVKSTGDKYTDTEFYWSSDSSFEDFLYRLKSYFISMGYYS